MKLLTNEWQKLYEKAKFVMLVKKISKISMLKIKDITKLEIIVLMNVEALHIAYVI